MGLVRGVARTAAIAGTATAVSNRVSRRQAGRWAEQEQQAAPQQYAAPPQQYAPPPPAEAAPSNDDMLVQLEKLGDLLAKGILTQSEFDAQKAKLLYGS
jgi:hypothetical protein